MRDQSGPEVARDDRSRYRSPITLAVRALYADRGRKGPRISRSSSRRRSPTRKRQRAELAWLMDRDGPGDIAGVSRFPSAVVRLDQVKTGASALEDVDGIDDDRR
jgi:hypothetical protein